MRETDSHMWCCANHYEIQMTPPPRKNHLIYIKGCIIDVKTIHIEAFDVVYWAIKPC